MIFWLKNRRPDRWKDRREDVHDGNLNLKVKVINAYKLDGSSQQETITAMEVQAESSPVLSDAVPVPVGASGHVPAFPGSSRA